jgi:hypothetical protein
MNVKRLVEDERTMALNVEALVIRGAGAATIAQCEAGTHLFYSANDSLAPLQVRVLPFVDGDRREVLNEESFDLPPVIRVYETEGATLDLRSGLMTLKTPTAEELRALVLAMLPLPLEVEEELG